MSERTLHAAILAQLAETGFPVFDGHVPLDAETRAPADQRYLVLYVAPPRRTTEDIVGGYVEESLYFQVTSVGRAQVQAYDVATATTRALAGWEADVTGWSCGPCDPTSSTAIARDDDIPSTLIFFSTATFKIESTRVSA